MNEYGKRSGHWPIPRKQYNYTVAVAEQVELKDERVPM